MPYWEPGTCCSSYCQPQPLNQSVMSSLRNDRSISAPPAIGYVSPSDHGVNPMTTSRFRNEAIALARITPKSWLCSRTCRMKIPSTEVSQSRKSQITSANGSAAEDPSIPV
jgi:hypothetical protein